MSRSPPSESVRDTQRSAGVTARNSSIILARLNRASPPPDHDAGGRASASMPSQMTLRGMRRLERRMNMEENHYLTQRSRNQNSVLNPPLDMRQLDYVSSYDSNLMCPICRCPLVDPVLLAECDHCFCRECIRQCWTTLIPTSSGLRGDCPSCRTPASLGPKSATSKILVNILDELLVNCPKREKGCTAQLRRGEVQDHVSIYCGYATVECAKDDCQLPVRRQDLVKGCRHYGVSCFDCHQTLLKADLESHWEIECPDRTVHCHMCKSDIGYRDSEKHTKQICPAISLPCPGEGVGCIYVGKKAELECHATACFLAKLAPLLGAQTQRMDEQQLAQRQLSRKVEVLENGFAAMQNIMYPELESPDNASADETRIPLLESHRRLQRGDMNVSGTRSSINYVGFEVSPSSRAAGSIADDSWSSHSRAADAASSLASESRVEGAPEPTRYLAGSGSGHSFTALTSHGPPYVSPLHHLLSMHESLRSEMSHVSAALSELDGRHSMQILNENLRAREETAYLGGQMAGISRQVHWLTSAQLQRQQGRGVAAGSSSAAASNSDIAGAGAGVEVAVNAVNTAATALRGAARLVSVGGESTGMRRRPSEEGRTKL